MERFMVALDASKASEAALRWVCTLPTACSALPRVAAPTLVLVPPLES